jgi:H+/Cl- antiporter ClcA
MPSKNTRSHPPSPKGFYADWGAIQRILRWCGLSIGPAFLAAILTTMLMDIANREQLLRSSHSWLYPLLPAGAMAIYFFQRPFPQKAQALALPGLHESRPGVPRYSLPFIYGSTLLTHLFGASAGREGAGMQAAATIGQEFAGWYALDATPRQVIISASVAAAFGALFGTPIAAAVFSLELLRMERFPYNALVPCGIGGVLGLGVTALMGSQATQFRYLFSHTPGLSFDGMFRFDLRLLLVVVLLGIVIGLLSCAFTELVRRVRYLASWFIEPRWLAPLLASIVLALLGYFTPARDYMGLGILPVAPHSPSILTAFLPGYQPPFTWIWKLLLTLLTLTAGFRGGEIVPLLYMGTTLAHTLTPLTGIDLSLLCSLAFIATLAAAANTPIAAIFLAAELFGSQHIVYFAFCSLVAYFLSPATKTPGRPAIRGIPKLFTQFIDPTSHNPNQHQKV